MRKKVTLDYNDNDPLVIVTLINPILNRKKKALAYLDTGSDSVVISRDLWLNLQLDMDECMGISVVGSVFDTWYTFIDLDFLGDKHTNVLACYNEAAGDVLIGRNILDKYSITFDGRNSKLYIE
jgi:hypothetical protein